MSNGALIRRAVLSDATRISELTQTIQALHAQAMPDVFKPATAQSFSEHLVCQLLAQPASVFLVAADGDDVVGHLYAEVQHVAASSIKYATTRMLVHQAVVDVAWQRRGIGHRLLQQVRQIAEAEHIPALVIDVWDFNQTAHDFYRKHGFRDTRHAMSLSLSPLGAPRSEV
ncbi:MAG: GNAT family N-acetyltransferase [Candidatus Eremiobacteraeota bacterium]|nr:GNAT family N-acetyltransferase [Candidatus Eremiobacteraeota bacterium]